MATQKQNLWGEMCHWKLCVGTSFWVATTSRCCRNKNKSSWEAVLSLQRASWAKSNVASILEAHFRKEALFVIGRLLFGNLVHLLFSLQRCWFFLMLFCKGKTKTKKSTLVEWLLFFQGWIVCYLLYKFVLKPFVTVLT